MEEGWERLIPIVRVYAWWFTLALFLVGLSYLKVINFIRNPLETGMVKTYTLTGNALYWLETPVRMLNYWFTGSQRMSDLENRLAQMAVDRQQLTELKLSNQQLSQLTGTDGAKLKLTNSMFFGKMVIGSEVGLINLGQGQGITEGSIVLSNEGVLVGRVTRVGNYVSHILRPFDYGSQVAVRVLGESTTGILSGDGTNARLVGVLQKDELKINDILVTSGADELYPEGVAVGQVESVTGEAAEVTKGGAIKLWANRGEEAIVVKN
jgi:cell shape-determining protein MreC